MAKARRSRPKREIRWEYEKPGVRWNSTKQQDMVNQMARFAKNCAIEATNDLRERVTEIERRLAAGHATDTETKIAVGAELWVYNPVHGRCKVVWVGREHFAYETCEYIQPHVEGFLPLDGNIAANYEGHRLWTLTP